jgi:hypothetical protein
MQQQIIGMACVSICLNSLLLVVVVVVTGTIVFFFVFFVLIFTWGLWIMLLGQISARIAFKF